MCDILFLPRTKTIITFKINRGKNKPNEFLCIETISFLF